MKTILFVAAVVAGSLMSMPTTAQTQTTQARLQEAGSLQSGSYHIRASVGTPVTVENGLLGLAAHQAASARQAEGPPDTGAGVPVRFELAPAYPNPFNPQTTLRVSVPKATHVRLEVFDALGRRVSTLLNRELAAGWHAVLVDARTWPSGTYFSRLEAGSFREVQQLLLMK